MEFINSQTPLFTSSWVTNLTASALLWFSASLTTREHFRDGAVTSNRNTFSEMGESYLQWSIWEGNLRGNGNESKTNQKVEVSKHGKNKLNIWQVYRRIQTIIQKMWDKPLERSLFVRLSHSYFRSLLGLRSSVSDCRNSHGLQYMNRPWFK